MLEEGGKRSANSSSSALTSGVSADVQRTNDFMHGLFGKNITEDDLATFARRVVT